MLFRSLTEVPFVNAAAWLVSKACFEKVGLFEPLFNHYGEDRNFCNRLRFHGFRIGIATSSKIVHDRIVSRNFKKDVFQSEYKILNAFLDINNNVVLSSAIALKNVFGLPRFFYKNYAISKILSLFIDLSKYYLKIMLNCKKILNIRTQSIKGINGL